MRRMYSENQLKEVIEEYGLTEQDVIEMLVGKYVRIMDAPTSTTLTDEQIAQISEGVFIKGEFLGVQNPILCPAYIDGTLKIGLVITMNTIYCYTINSSNVISLASSTSQRIYLNSIYAINNKGIPPYPANTGTFTFKCVNGTLTWVADE